MTRQYINHSAERWPLIEDLLGLGFTLNQVAEVGGFSVATIQNDLRAHGGTIATLFPDRPKDPAERYRRAFRRYAALPDEETHRSPSQQQLFDALEVLLELDRMRDFLDGVLAVDRRFLVWSVSEPGDQPWANLVQATLGGMGSSMPSSSGFWHLVCEVQNGQTEPSGPKDPLILTIIDVDWMRERVLPVLTPERLAPLKEFVRTVVEPKPGEAEKGLNERESRVIILRYGLDGEPPQTLEEAGATLLVTRERVRQSEVKALRKLRHCRQALAPLGPYGNAAPERLQIRDLERRVRDLTERLVAITTDVSKLADIDFPVETFGRRCDELDLSVRTANCLENARIELIGQLVQYSEAELLKVKNFGRKSLNEIKEILHEMGLSLGTRSPALMARYPISRP